MARGKQAQCPQTKEQANGGPDSQIMGLGVQFSKVTIKGELSHPGPNQSEKKEAGRQQQEKGVP